MGIFRVPTAVGLIILLLSAVAAADERIHHFDSRIVIHADGSMTVTETITVTAEGKKIHRGIYRDLPLTYPGPWFTQIVMPLEVTKVLRDGQPEPWHTKQENGELRIYIGQEDRLLQPGRYTYTLEYRTNHCIDFYDTHDRLYWNVTGNDWDFSIEKATAVIELPRPAPLSELRHKAYTGKKGERGLSYTSWIDARAGHIHYESTSILLPGQGITIIGEFPKAIIDEPTRDQRIAVFWQSNRPLLVGLIGLGLVILYYIFAWSVVGRDPPRGIVQPRFEPPEGLSPAAARFIWRLGYDNRCFSAAIISLANKGVAELHHQADGSFLLKRLTRDFSALSPGERAMAEHLLTSEEIRLDPKNQRTIKAAGEALARYLKLEYEGTLFFTNRRWLIPGLVLSLAVLVVALLMAPSDQMLLGLFLVVWLAGWSTGVVALLGMVTTTWGQAIGGGGVPAWAAAIFSTLFALPFVVGEIVGLTMLGLAVGVVMIPVLLVIVGVNALFFHLLERPTAMGRSIMDQIEGFRYYLKQRPEQVPSYGRNATEHYDEYLAYAVALDAEQEWAERISPVLAYAQAGGDSHIRHYPRWFRRHGNSKPIGGGLGSALSGALARSNSSSSRGGGGGGFSGGGRGGGGGGGW